MLRVFTVQSVVYRYAETVRRSTQRVGRRACLQARDVISMQLFRPRVRWGWSCKGEGGEGAMAQPQPKTKHPDTTFSKHHALRVMGHGRATYSQVCGLVLFVLVGRLGLMQLDAIGIIGIFGYVTSHKTHGRRDDPTTRWLRRLTAFIGFPSIIGGTLAFPHFHGRAGGHGCKMFHVT